MTPIPVSVVRELHPAYRARSSGEFHLGDVRALLPGLEEAYAGKHGALEAAKAGVVDDVIEPKETRKYIIAALEVLANKHDVNLPKKHGNLPL